jgi:hypothetical protein
MKKLLFLFTALLLISCSSEDDNETSEPKTFLEKNDGLGFYDDDGYYVFFYNDEIFLKTVDLGEPTSNNPDEENFCAEYKEGANEVSDGEIYNVSILTNDLDRLVVKSIAVVEDDSSYGEEYYTEIVEYIVNPTQNSMTEEWDSDDMPYTFFKTTTTYSSLCN